MDRNLGATRVATSSTDPDAYGDLYQWGRGADGHELRNSQNINWTSGSDQPGTRDFILANTSPFDWRSPQNPNLWQGNGVNNPCPSGFRLPIASEWDDERNSWISNNAAGAFASPLKLTMAGYRRYNDGSLTTSVGANGNYWSSTISTFDITRSFSSTFTSTTTRAPSDRRAEGNSVRCIMQ
jgi:uncharacterized protein (TIGR02145 family)